MENRAVFCWTRNRKKLVLNDISSKVKWNIHTTMKACRCVETVIFLVQLDYMYLKLLITKVALSLSICNERQQNDMFTD